MLLDGAIRLYQLRINFQVPETPKEQKQKWGSLCLILLQGKMLHSPKTKEFKNVGLDKIERP